MPVIPPVHLVSLSYNVLANSSAKMAGTELEAVQAESAVDRCADPDEAEGIRNVINVSLQITTCRTCCRSGYTCCIVKKFNNSGGKLVGTEMMLMRHVSN